MSRGVIIDLTGVNGCDTLLSRVGYNWSFLLFELPVNQFIYLISYEHLW